MKPKFVVTDNGQEVGVYESALEAMRVAEKLAISHGYYEYEGKRERGVSNVWCHNDDPGKGCVTISYDKEFCQSRTGKVLLFAESMGSCAPVMVIGGFAGLIIGLMLAQASLSVIPDMKEILIKAIPAMLSCFVFCVGITYMTGIIYDMIISPWKAVLAAVAILLVTISLWYLFIFVLLAPALAFAAKESKYGS